MPQFSACFLNRRLKNPIFDLGFLKSDPFRDLAKMIETK